MRRGRVVQPPSPSRAKRCRWLALAAVAACAASAAASAAPVGGPTILLQHGMAGVRLGMSEDQARAALGPGVTTRRGASDFGPYLQLLSRSRGLTVTLQGARRVTNLSTTGRALRTAAGIGVGSSEREVRRRVRGVRCAVVVGTRLCTLGRAEPGRTVSDFFIRAGRVSRVNVGYVID
jgi:hypothetical protein